ncbi:UDP-N-acetylglucosamine 2-epimerase (non-hydrolyzing) [bacterium]|nr:UDP-N-acetylglucosamine 2-epimerase (non-hydrolyzing) [bacterium]
MRIISLVGARPQFVKLFPLSRALRENHQEILVHTGQHYDDELSNIFFRELELPVPDYNLEVGSLAHGAQTGLMLKRIEDVLLFEKPDLMVVFGDTNSTLAGALAASKMQIPIAHVEAGLRSFNRLMPEEINRVLTDHLSDLLFCPTPTSVNNLRAEGLEEGVHLVGDVMSESLEHCLPIAEARSDILNRLQLKPGDYYLLTMHRAENTNDPKILANILTNVQKLDKIVYYPIHPRTRYYINKYGLGSILGARLRLIDPVSYLDMLVLEKNAEAILTDSGGVQKEAFWLKVPCLVLRAESEWVEMLASGANRLVLSELNQLPQIFMDMKGNKSSQDLHGDSQIKTSVRIKELINEFY